MFAYSFNNESKDELNQETKEIIDSRLKIDALIAKAAPAWPIEKINRMDLAILRLAVFELTRQKEIPPKVVVDEAVEIAKEFGSDASAGFVNAVLGKLIEELDITT